MVITVIKPRKEKIYYAFDTESPGNYGTGMKRETAIKDLEKKQKIKSKVLADFDKYEMFNPEAREYVAGLISRNYEAIKEIRKDA